MSAAVLAINIRGGPLTLCIFFAPKAAFVGLFGAAGSGLNDFEDVEGFEGLKGFVDAVADLGGFAGDGDDHMAIFGEKFGVGNLASPGLLFRDGKPWAVEDFVVSLDRRMGWQGGDDNAPPEMGDVFCSGFMCGDGPFVDANIDGSGFRVRFGSFDAAGESADAIFFQKGKSFQA